MITNEIIAMAKEAGLLPDNSHPTPETRAMRKRCEVVMRFAALVAEAEREACAQVCESEWATDAEHAFGGELAALIRARGAP